MTSRPTAESGPGVTGIVLAGGRSRRFGSDKLRAEIDGRTLLDHAVAAVGAVAGEILVVVGPGDDRTLPRSSRPIRRVTDREAGGGPLIGLLAGLEAAAEPLVVVVGGDMPTLLPDVLTLMIRTLTAADRAIAAVVLTARGRSEPLPAVVRTGAASDVVGRLVADGERSLQGLFTRLPTRALDEGEWRPLDPSGATIRDVDRPSDLEGS